MPKSTKMLGGATAVLTAVLTSVPSSGAIMTMTGSGNPLISHAAHPISDISLTIDTSTLQYVSSDSYSSSYTIAGSLSITDGLTGQTINSSGLLDLTEQDTNANGQLSGSAQCTFIGYSGLNGGNNFGLFAGYSGTNAPALGESIIDYTFQNAYPADVGTAYSYNPNSGNLTASGDIMTSTVPEPASGLLGLGVASAVLARRARRTQPVLETAIA